MLDKNTKQKCENNPSIRDLKIRNIEHAIDQAEKIIKESKVGAAELSFLKSSIIIKIIIVSCVVSFKFD